MSVDDNPEDETGRVPRCPRCGGRMVLVASSLGQAMFHHASHGLVECLEGRVT